MASYKNLSKAEREKQKKLKENEELRIAIEENFNEWVLKFENKAFDLDCSKEEVAEDFFERYMKNDIKALSSLARSVLKSYYFTKKDEVLPYIDQENLSIKNSAGLVNKFLSDYITEDKNITSKNQTEVFSYISGLAMDKLEDIFGDVIYFNIENISDKNVTEVRRKFASVIKERGYVPVSRDPNFLIRANSKQQNIEVKEEHQGLLLRTYRNIVKEYIAHYSKHVSPDFTNEQFNAWWDTIALCLDNIENRMTKETKKTPEFVGAKSEVTKFYNETKEKIRKTQTTEGRKGDYCKLVKDAIANKTNGHATESDEQVLNDFKQKIAKLNRALSVKDEFGESYPVNYFAVMPIHPANIFTLLANYEKWCAESREEAQFVADTKSLVRSNLPAQIRNNGDVCDIAHELKLFKMKKTINGKVYDLSTDKAFEEFVKKVTEFVDKNNLPHNDLCVRLVGKDIQVGRDPIKLSEVHEKKQDRNK